MINPLNVKRLLATNMELHAMVRVWVWVCGAGHVHASQDKLCISRHVRGTSLVGSPASRGWLGALVGRTGKKASKSSLAGR